MPICITPDFIKVGNHCLYQTGNNCLLFSGTIYARALSTSNVNYNEVNVASQGYGYISGGYNRIERFPFAVDGNSTCVGPASPSCNFYFNSTSSTTHGYTLHGAYYNTIRRFPFASSISFSDVGPSTQLQNQQGISSATHGYFVGGVTPAYPPATITNMYRFPFASPTATSSVGNLINNRMFGAVGNSTTTGYVSGGCQIPGTGTTSVEKFPLATGTTNSTLAFSMSGGVFYTNGTGFNSSTHFYSAFYDTFNKMSFASDSTYSCIGNFPAPIFRGSGNQYKWGGTSSASSGFQFGNYNNGTSYGNRINKFPFANETNYSFVGYMTNEKSLPGGHSSP